MAIAQGFTQYINNNAEALRHKFVSHRGKITLSVSALIPTTNSQWAEIITKWGLKIREHIDPKLYQLMLCDFTTTTETINIASKVVMMNAFQQYFDYRLVGICGIPTITLLGTVNDWKTIRDRINILAQYNLSWWTDRLLPICEEFIATAAGKPNLEFWQNIYKSQKVYGGDVITGWLADLFPYLKDYITQKPVIKNSILDILRHKITVDDGIRLQLLPTGLSEATITLQKGNNQKELELIGGFIGVTQNNNKYLQPEIGWGVREKDRLSQLINILASNKKSQVSSDCSKINYLPEIPKELIQVAQKLAGVTIYADSSNSWYFNKPEEYERIVSKWEAVGEIVVFEQMLTQFAKLNDGRCLACSFISKTSGTRKDNNFKRWYETRVVVTKTKIGEWEFFKGDVELLILEETKIIATSITQLLERIISAKGKYYFDDPNFIPDESLDTLEKH